ncbi:hypothetical protein [Herbidospora sp. RD11066]
MILFPAVFHLAALFLPWAFESRLPDPIAVHFTAGVADQAIGLWTSVVEDLLLSCFVWAVFALVALLRPAGSIGRRAAAGVSVGLAVLLDTASVMATVVGNYGATVWQEAHATSWAPAVAICAALASAVFAYVCVSPRRRPADLDDVLPDDPVAGPPRQGRSVWIGSAKNRPLFWRSLVTACLLAGLVVAGVIWVVIPLALSLATLHLWSRVTAVFDGRTLTVRGRLPRPALRRIDLADMETAEAIEVDPGQWGWGWRIRSLRTRAVVIRKGEALLVALRDGTEFTVTVDHAALGAEEIRRALRSAAGLPRP